MLEELKREVYEANMELWRRGVVIYTWGNVSGMDRAKGLVVIKPSGVPYDELTPETMSVVDLDCNLVDGKYRPSSDTPTHIEIYKLSPEIGGVVHTHSINAVAFAQAGRDIPPLGTTHADYFYGPIPCTRSLTDEEISGEYEKKAGFVIAECLCGKDPMATPGINIKNHGPFAWGKDPREAVHNAVVLENIADMALRTLAINPNAAPAPKYLIDRHYFRKHGKNSYYGQK